MIDGTVKYALEIGGAINPTLPPVIRLAPATSTRTFRSATDASIFALKHITPYGYRFRVMRIEAQGVH